MAKTIIDWDNEINLITRPLGSVINGLEAGKVAFRGILAEANIELKGKELAECAAITRFMYDDVLEQLLRLQKQVDIIYRSFVLARASV